MCRLHHTGPSYSYIHTHAYMLVVSLEQPQMREDPFKLPLHNTRVVIIRMAAWTASRSLERKSVGLGGGAPGRGVPLYGGQQRQAYIDVRSLKMKITTQDKREGGREGGLRRGGKNGGEGRKIDLSGGWDEPAEGGEGVTGWGKGERKVKMTPLE